MTDIKTLAELVSDLTPEELRLFDALLREAANKIHDDLMEERKRAAERKPDERKANKITARRRYYLKNRKKILAYNRARYHKNKQLAPAT